jgi:hypothetical protein
MPPGVKWPRRESDKSAPFSAKDDDDDDDDDNDDDTLSYTSIPPYMSMAWCLVKKKVKLSLGFSLTEHHDMRAYWGSVSIPHAFLTSALDGDEW